MGFVAFVLLCAGGYAVYLQQTSHELSTPSTAGGLSRDSEAEANAGEAVRRLSSVLSLASDYKVTGHVSAVYGTGTEKYLFVGGTGDHDLKYPEQDFNGAVARAFTGIDGAVYSPSTVKISDGGGDGVALSTSIQISLISPSGTKYSTAYLASWSTRTTIGIVMQVGKPSESIGLAGVMRNIREDVED